MDHDNGSAATKTPGSLPPEPVEERPGVGIVTPSDYPEDDRAGGISEPPLDEDKEYERLNPGSGGRTPALPRSGEDRDNA